MEKAASCQRDRGGVLGGWMEEGEGIKQNMGKMGVERDFGTMRA